MKNTHSAVAVGSMPWLDEIPRQRLIEWWSVLNTKRTPHDLPVGADVEELFTLLSRKLTKRERLDFWNGDFSRGLNVRNFI